MAQPFIKSRKFPSVYHRESTVNTFRGKPDRVYWIQFRDSRGKQHFERIGPASQGITEEYANKKLIEKKNLVHLGENPDSGRKRAPSLNEVFDAFIEMARIEGKHTVPCASRYENHLKPYFGEATLADISEEALTRHKSELLKKMAPASVKHVFALMRRVINFGIRKKMWSGANPIGPQSDFRMPKVQNAGERFLTKEECDLLIDELEKRSPMIRDMAALALRTALRVTEIFDLRGKDIDAASNTLYVEAKGGKRQSVYVDDEILNMLAGYSRRPEELIFQKRDGGRLHEVYGAFSRAVDAVGLNAGIQDKKQRVWFHIFRHTCISWWAQSGKFTILELKEAARHDRIETTMRYAHLIPGGTRSKIADLDRELHGDPNSQS